MGDVIQLFRDTAFDPETVEVLCAAYDLAKRSMHDRTQPEVVRELIAQRIIALAETGERDPRALAASALDSFGLHYLSPPLGARRTGG